MFSVMVPTFEPGASLFKTLHSVLVQGWDKCDMQIAVVDDGSCGGDVTALVRSIDPTGRIEVHADGKRLGIGGNWNRAIHLAKGRFVHLLHQDDHVLPGFYKRMAGPLDGRQRIGMAFCRCRIADGTGRLLKTQMQQRLFAGILRGWQSRISVRQRIETPSAVVPRATYEMLGGYRTDLCQALDWEMWVRIAAHYLVWYEPRPLAVFHRHPLSETSRLKIRGDTWDDLVSAIRINARVFPSQTRQTIIDQSALWHARSALRQAQRLVSTNTLDVARMTIEKVYGFTALISLLRQRKQVEKRAAAILRKARAA